MIGTPSNHRASDSIYRGGDNVKQFQYYNAMWNDNLRPHMNSLISRLVTKAFEISLKVDYCHKKILDVTFGQQNNLNRLGYGRISIFTSGNSKTIGKRLH